MDTTGAERAYDLALARYREFGSEFGARDQLTHLALLDVAACLCDLDEYAEAVALLDAHVEQADQHLGPAHAITWRMRWKAVSYCRESASKIDRLDEMLEIAAANQVSRSDVKDVCTAKARAMGEMDDPNGADTVLGKLHPSHRALAPEEPDLYVLVAQAKECEATDAWHRAESAWLTVAERADGLSEAFEVQARVALHRIHHRIAPNRAHRREPGGAPLARFVHERLADEEHEALTLIETRPAWWQFDDGGRRLLTSPDRLWWQSAAAAGDVGRYVASQPPILTLRRIDAMFAMLDLAGRSGGRYEHLVALANCHRDHPDFQAQWHRSTINSWASPIAVALAP